MATVTRVLDSAFISLGGTDFSEQCTMLEITVDIKDEDVTTFAAEGWTQVVGTRKSAKVTAELLVSTAVDDFLWTNFGVNVAYVIRPDNGAQSPTNPEYTGECLVGNHTPIQGKPSDVGKVKLDMKVNGIPLRDIS